jgi:hypothetical protein
MNYYAWRDGAPPARGCWWVRFKDGSEELIPAGVRLVKSEVVSHAAPMPAVLAAALQAKSKRMESALEALRANLAGLAPDGQTTALSELVALGLGLGETAPTIGG